jgi:hypothetical protein
MRTESKILVGKRERNIPLLLGVDVRVEVRLVLWTRCMGVLTGFICLSTESGDLWRIRECICGFRRRLRIS